MDCQEIQDQEDRRGLKERRVTHARCAPCCPQTWETQWLCRASQALKESLDHQGQEREDQLGLWVQMARQDRRGNQEQVVSKEKRENRVLCAPLSESYLLTSSLVSRPKPCSRRARRESPRSD